MTRALINRKGIRSPFLDKVEPLKLSTAKSPFDSEEFIYEIKHDGFRGLAYKKESRVRLLSRNDVVFDQFQKINSELERYNHNIILDGEIVVLDNDGKVNFSELQRFRQKKMGKLAYFVFDILWLDGYNLTTLPLIERKKILLDVITHNPSDSIVYTDHVEKHGTDLFELIKKENIEGIVAKKKDSKYKEGIRSKEWIKIKAYQREEFIVAGFDLEMGEFVLGRTHGNKLIYSGHCGFHFMKNTPLEPVIELLSKHQIKKSSISKLPDNIKNVIWVNPIIKCEIQFSELTRYGRFRHPIIKSFSVK